MEVMTESSIKFVFLYFALNPASTNFQTMSGINAAIIEANVKKIQHV